MSSIFFEGVRGKGRVLRKRDLLKVEIFVHFGYLNKEEAFACNPKLCSQENLAVALLAFTFFRFYCFGDHCSFSSPKYATDY